VSEEGDGALMFGFGGVSVEQLVQGGRGGQRVQQKDEGDQNHGNDRLAVTGVVPF
jgi:hypothetical protein